MKLQLHSDDYGYNAAVDRRILRLIDAGWISSVSVLSTMASRLSLGTLRVRSRRRASIRIALHVNLSERRFFSTLWKIFTRRVTVDEVVRDVEKQLRVLKKAGIKVTAIDSHQHLHALSPVAEAVALVAQKHHIPSIRSYRRVKRYTWIAEAKYAVLKAAAIASYAIYYGRLGLPPSWHIEGDSLAVMSWEGKSWNAASPKTRSRRPFSWQEKDRMRSLKQVTLVIHPYLPFDSNTTYMKFFNRNRKGVSM